MMTLESPFLYEDILERTTLDVLTGCILWTRTKDAQGYGQIWLYGRGGKYYSAHRVTYQMFAPIPEGLVLDHLCRVRHCVNPNHLEPVTVAENNLRGEGIMAQYAKRTHCPKGHPYEGENLWYTPWGNGGKGARRCRECKRLGNARYRAQVKARKEAA